MMIIAELNVLFLCILSTARSFENEDLIKMAVDLMAVTKTHKLLILSDVSFCLEDTDIHWLHAQSKENQLTHLTVSSALCVSLFF